jgi:cell division septation protein DedD
MKHTLLLLAFPSLLAAQSDSLPRNAADSAVAQARALAREGKEAEGRKILDSLMKAMSPDSASYAEALYWRGNLAATAADAERDYRRLLIEAPLSPRAEDTVLRLASLLQARGDRRGASDYYQRYMLTYADTPARPRVALSLVRLLFDQGPQMQARACEALRMGREAIPRSNLELRNQLEYYEPRCVAEVAPTPAAAAAESTTVAPTGRQSATSSDSAPKPAAAPAPASSLPPSSTGALAQFYSVQIAAYNSKEPAASLASLLKERGLDARVDGTVAPFRVRVGKYSTRADAVKAAATLKAQGHSGFITLVQGTK